MRRSTVGVFLFTFISVLPLYGATSEERIVAQARLNALVNSLTIGTLATVSAGDANGDGMVTVADIFYLINFLFTGGPAPVAVSALDTPNAQQIAILRWYDANQASITFAVGTSPTGVAFDGASIWVANAASNNVTKLRASDGALLGTFAVGTAPRGVAFDGGSIWVANFGSNTVTKLRASDGVLQGTFCRWYQSVWGGVRRHEHLGCEPRQQHGHEVAG